MLTSKNYWRSRVWPLLATDEAGGAGTAVKDDAKSDTADDPEEFKGLDDNTRDILRRYNEQREAARKDASAAKKERDVLKREKEEREAEETKAKDEQAAEAGQFEGLAKKREAERDAARKEAASLQAKVDQLQAAIEDAITSEWKTLPSEVLDAYIGDEDDALAKLAFLPKGKALAVKLAEKADPARGNGQDPRSRGAGNPNKATEDEARRANASRYAN